MDRDYLLFLKFYSLFSSLFLEKTNKNSYICDTNLE